MENIDEQQRKPRRTRGTPSYYYRNKVAVAAIIGGTAIFALFSCTPIYRGAVEKFQREFLTVTEEETDRKFIFNLLGAPRTSRGIQETLDDKKKIDTER